MSRISNNANIGFKIIFQYQSFIVNILNNKFRIKKCIKVNFTICIFWDKSL